MSASGSIVVHIVSGLVLFDLGVVCFIGDPLLLGSIVMTLGRRRYRRVAAANPGQHAWYVVAHVRGTRRSYALLIDAELIQLLTLGDLITYTWPRGRLVSAAVGSISVAVLGPARPALVLSFVAGEPTSVAIICPTFVSFWSSREIAEQGRRVLMTPLAPTRN